MKSPKKGDIGYIKSYRGTYAIRLKDGSWKEIYQDKSWDADMSPKGFTERVRGIKECLYDLTNEKGELSAKLKQVPPNKPKRTEIRYKNNVKFFPKFELKKEDRLKTWVD